jgi:2,3-bisphosphoglycerate-dependent phosphoglycerate mutase
MAAIRVYLVRHGETQANRDGVIQGQLDTELNAEGVEQARRTADALENVSFAAAHASDLRRAAKVRCGGTVFVTKLAEPAVEARY